MASILFGRKKSYEPSPRFSHGAAAVGGRCYLWGGCVQDFTESERRKLASTVEIFDPQLGTWEEHPTTGVPPPGLYSGACTSLLDSLHWFGGYDGKYFYNSLHKLDPITLEWRELQPLNQANGPMKKIGCGMVAFFRDQLAVFGGYGIPTGPIQPGAMFTKSTDYTEGSGWSNELHVFNIIEGKWSSPPTTGPRPPPCSNFSFTAINNHQAVLFGGGQPGSGSRVSDCYLMDFVSMEWTKLERPVGAPWPVERASHAAICLNYGEEHPQLLVTGGVDNNATTLQDAWILDVKSVKWRELNLPEDVQPRMWHTATALNLWPGRTQVTMFGGSPKWESGKTDAAQQKLAKTTALEFESVKLPPSGDCPPTREWVLVDVVKSSHLGSRKRLARLEKMKQTKIGPEGEREVQELKERVCQKEDRVAILEQQLSQAKMDLVEQIRMKDEAKSAAELQLNQTIRALQREIQSKLSTFRQAWKQAERQVKVRQQALQRQIQVKEEENLELEQQLHQQIQAKENVKAMLEQQLHQKGEQIRFNNEDKVELEQQLRQKGEQIQYNKENKEQQLHEKEEQIQTKDRENAELEEQVHQKEEQIRAKNKFGSDKVEVRHDNEEADVLQFQDQNVQTEIVQIKAQAESTTQQQAGFGEVEMNEQQIQTETVQPAEPHVETGGSDEVEVKDNQTRIETVDQEVQAGETVHQQEYLRGFETIAETSFSIPDSHCHSFEWQRYGLKLHIPEGAVPMELIECRVDIKVGLSGQFRIPDDLQLVSCIYWLSGPQRPFLKPVTLEIEHCALLQDSSQSESLRFIVAKCSQPELPYQFRVLEKGTFVPQSSYGSIQVSQFSFFGITISRRSSRLSQYYSALFYIQKGLHKWHVDFVITLHLKGSLKAIQDKYSRLHAISGPGFKVQFENNLISLVIPEDGVCLKNGWTITPLVPPVIDKQQVDAFKSWQKVPYCRLQVKLDKDKEPVELEHRVKLQGAERPFDFFTITCPPEEFVERPSRVKSGERKQFGGSEQGDLSSKYAGLESEPELSDLMNEVASKVSAKWKQISIQLGLTPNDEECFMASTPNDPIQCITSVFKVWKKRATKPYTWSTVIEVLSAAAVDEIRLAKELTTKLSAVHCPSPCKDC